MIYSCFLVVKENDNEFIFFQGEILEICFSSKYTYIFKGFYKGSFPINLPLKLIHNNIEIELTK